MCGNDRGETLAATRGPPPQLYTEMHVRPVPVATPTILAIESSCDDTGAAVWRGGRLASNVVASQLQHAATGGVVPEVASRAHQHTIVPVVEEALRRADATPTDLDAVAVTRGPGLMGSLVVGVAFAKAYAAALAVPLVEVNHMRAHVLAHFATDDPPAFPFLCLTVSGGHTQLLIVRGPADFEEIGRTLDDAAGEAFDKSGKLLGLPYPAGPHIDRLAREGTPVYAFAKPNMPGLDFSYSGLKTSVLYFLRDRKAEDERFVEDHLADLCASVQAAIVESLLVKVREALAQTGLRRLALAGGVSANSGLRAGARVLAEELAVRLYLTPIALATDNAGMIAAAAHFAYAQRRFAADDLAPAARLPVDHDERDRDERKDDERDRVAAAGSQPAQ